MKQRLRQFIVWMALCVLITGTGIGLVFNAAFAGEAPEPAAEEAEDNDGGASEGVMIAMAVAAVTIGASWSAAYAVAKVGSAAMGAVSENPDLMARSLIFVGLAEGIAIYGLIVAIMLLGKM